jgi:hypothetical protein
MKIDEYFVNIKDWDNLIKTNRDRFLLYYKYCNKEYGNKLSHKYSLFVYKTFPNIQCIRAGAVMWEFNPKTGRLKTIANRCDEISLNESLELLYKAVLDMEKKVNR